MATDSELVGLARRFLYVREASPNAGQRVEAIQRWSGGAKGQSWCAHFATMLLDLAFGGSAPIPRTGSCDEIYQLAKAKGWLTATPAVGDLFLYVRDGTEDAHHVGIVTSVAPLRGIAGNTSADGKSSNGDRVAEHDISAHVFVHYPREGIA